MSSSFSISGIEVESVEDSRLVILQEDIKLALVSTEGLGIRDLNPKVLRNSVDLMAKVISSISPNMNRQDLSQSMMKSISRFGLNEGFILPSLNIID